MKSSYHKEQKKKVVLKEHVHAFIGQEAQFHRRQADLEFVAGCCPLTV
ncbi:MAG TPA: hypothetical protein VFC66_00380 [Anaerolineaceae bacterium]|jgi:hypothetical protein|nr:hypothetical protein [Anaerolineaceae bacterium]